MSQAETKPRTIGNLQTGAAVGCKLGATCLRECVRGAVVATALFSLLTAVPAIAHEQSNITASKPAPQTRPAGAADLLVRNAPATRSAFDRDILPSLDLIDAQTDIKVFLQSWVPEELRVAALRRAWTGDPTIRDFIGLQEMDWDFSDPDSILGFGELGPEVDIERMVAQIFGETPRVVASLPERRPGLFSRVVLRLFDLGSTASAAP